MKRVCHGRLLQSLQDKSDTTVNYLDCDIETLRKWLKFCFSDDKMTIENHGIYWHIDHVIPVSKFNLKNDAEARLCFSYLNLMPLRNSREVESARQLLEHLLVHEFLN